MIRFPAASFLISRLAPVFIAGAGVAGADMTSPYAGTARKTVTPQVAAPSKRASSPVVRQQVSFAGAAQGPASRILYPWKLYVTSTIFWIGELPTSRNPTPNCKSSWDQQWSANFGGYDDPDPTNRIADFANNDFRPKSFTPKLNPFYIALPYNDVLGYGRHKPEAARVIPWFARLQPAPGKTVCKGRWVQIYNGRRSCYAQWEDCGPWVTDDWEFVFGTKPPKTTQNGKAGIDISPSVRDYLSIRSGQKVHWRFVEASQVPYGPWKKYGQDQPVADSAVRPGTDPESERRYLEYLRKLRDEEFQKRPVGQPLN